MSKRSRKPSPSTTRLRSHQRVTEAQMMQILDDPYWWATLCYDIDRGRA